MNGVKQAQSVRVVEAWGEHHVSNAGESNGRPVELLWVAGACFK